MSGLEVIGGISAIISIIDAAVKTYHGARKDLKLPEAFQVVGRRLPVILDTLQTCKLHLQPIQNSLSADVCAALEQILDVCDQKAGKLREIFERVIPGDGDGWEKRYLKVFKRLGQGNKVEEIMLALTEDVQLLVNHHAVKSARPEQLVELDTIVKEMKSVKSSISENETSGMTFNSNGGAQTNNVNSGAGQQINNNASVGTQYFGSVNVYEYSNETSATAEGEEKNCLSALWHTTPALTDPIQDRRTIMDKKGLRTRGTCEWIREDRVYKQWLCSPSQALWLSGGPGRGKTMLSLFLTEELSRTSEISNDGTATVLQYFCTQDADERRNTAIAIVRSLIYQLLQKHEKLVKYLVEDFKVQRKALFVESDSSLQSLWACFERMLYDTSLSSSIYCVIDGLDECKPASLDVLSKRLAEFHHPGTRLSAASHFKLIISSREKPAFLTQAFANLPRIRLESEALRAHVSSDIGRFIQIKVNALCRSGDYSPQLRAHVLHIFQQRAQGTFLWVSLVAKELEEHTRDEVKDALERFPPGLATLYGRMLLQIPVRRREMTARILRWVAMAVRPLTLSELAAAVGVVAEPSSGLDLSDAIRLRVENCGTMLTTTTTTTTTGEKGETQVGMIHQSVKEYLLRNVPDPKAELEFFRVKQVEAHTEIVGQCLNCLESNVTVVTQREESMEGSHPLLWYATANWMKHARCVLDHNSEIFLPSRPFYMEPPSLARRMWVRADHCLSEYYGRLNESSSMLHIAAHLGIWQLVQRLLDENDKRSTEKALSHPAILNERDVNGCTALHLAVQQRHTTTVQLLVQRGANCRIRDVNGYNAFFSAVSINSEPIVSLLLRPRPVVDVNDRGTGGNTVLHEAVRSGHKNMVRLLLENGADPNLKNTKSESVLTLAAQGGQEEIVRLLLDAGADLDTDGDDKNCQVLTLLEEARRREKEAVVRLLLQRAPKLDASKEDGGLLLHWAANRGHLEVCRLLLSLGADANFGDNDPVLHEAALNGNEEVMMLLLKTGNANINTKDGCGRTALQLAVHRELKKATQLLLEKHANANTQDSQGQIPLHLAVQSRCQTVARLLIEHGASIDAKDKWQHTALHTATLRGYVDMVHFLLKKGASPDIKDRAGRTALHFAAEAENVPTLRLLLTASPHLVNHGDDCGRTALHEAASRGVPKIAELLLQGHANPNSQDKWGRTPLHNAAERGHKSVVELLLEKGADSSMLSVNGSAAVHLATSQDHTEIRELLLDDFVAHHLPETNDGWIDLS